MRPPGAEAGRLVVHDGRADHSQPTTLPDLSLTEELIGAGVLTLRRRYPGRDTRVAIELAGIWLLEHVRRLGGDTDAAE